MRFFLLLNCTQDTWNPGKQRDPSKVTKQSGLWASSSYLHFISPPKKEGLTLLPFFYTFFFLQEQFIKILKERLRLDSLQNDHRSWVLEKPQGLDCITYVDTLEYSLPFLPSRKQDPGRLQGFLFPFTAKETIEKTKLKKKWCSSQTLVCIRIF